MGIGSFRWFRGLLSCSPPLLQIPLLWIKLDPRIIDLRLLWVTLPQLFAQITNERNAGERLVAAESSRAHIIVVNLWQSLIERLISRCLMQFRIAVPLVDIHREEITRAHIEPDPEAGEERGATRLLAALNH